MAEMLRVPKPNSVDGSGGGGRVWLIAAQSNHPALGNRMIVEIPIPLSE